MKPLHIIAAALALTATQAAGAQTMDIQRHGDTTIVNIDNPTKYLLLPVEEDQPESQVMLYTDNAADTWMDVRLAQNKVDYYVPLPSRQRIYRNGQDSQPQTQRTGPPERTDAAQ